MKQLRLIMLAMFALLALGAVGSTVAMAEDGPPAILVLEGKVTDLEFKGSNAAATELSTLNNKKIEGVGLEASLKGCLPLGGTNEKDTNLCHEGLLKFEKTKQGAVACRSETAAGVKDAIETILVLVDAHLADEKTSTSVLEPLIIFEVLGVAKEAELTINCGGVKEKVKGRIGCLLTPGLTEIAAGAAITVSCKTKSAGDQETGTCEETKVLCEELAAKPLEGNLGAGFEMASQSTTIEVKANKNIFIDD